jgi:ribosomal-protein-serine acetyltransferase
MNLLIVDNDITLRELYEKDAEPLFQLTDSNRTYLRAWLPWLDQNTSIVHTKWFIQNSLQQARDDAGAQFGIWFQGELVGVIGYHFLDKTNRSTNLGYWLSEPVQGRGIMTKACAKIVEDAFVNKKINRVEIRCAVENKKSRAMSERLGFSFEGILRQAEFCYDHYNDMAVCSLLAKDSASPLLQRGKSGRLPGAII